MAYLFPPQLGRLIQEELATGAYSSEDDVLIEVLQALRDRDESLAGIREGIADLDARRVRRLNVADDELRTKHGISRDE
jgi:Arc/MetJ-type ribon-helix-helix transcriptional regulator